MPQLEKTGTLLIASIPIQFYSPDNWQVIFYALSCLVLVIDVINKLRK